MNGMDAKRGSVLMEFVISMPMLFVLMMLVLQFSHIWLVRQFVSYSAFCAARSSLSVRPEEASDAAYDAARLVLAWVTMSGSAEKADLRENFIESKNLGRFSDIGDGYGVRYANASLRSWAGGDAEVPGWGRISESDSVDRRLTVKIDNSLWLANLSGNNPRLTMATVKFRMALLLPIAGAMVSWCAQHGFGGADGGELQVVSGWSGQHEQLPEERGHKDAYPYIELTETCVLPFPYSTANFPVGGYEGGFK